MVTRPATTMLGIYFEILTKGYWTQLLANSFSSFEMIRRLAGARVAALSTLGCRRSTGHHDLESLEARSLEREPCSQHFSR